jgi:hypothetical protein
VTTHRTSALVDAIAAAISSQVASAYGVYKNRSLTLTESEQELPALSVSAGRDDPLDPMGASNLSVLDSLLDVQVWAYAAGADETAVFATLADARRQAHIAIMADVTLGGLAMNARYGGAEAPQIGADGARIVGRQYSLWRIHYRVTAADPQ